MLTATEIKDGIDKAVKKHENDTPPAPGVIASLFGRVLVGQSKPEQDVVRWAVCEHLVGVASTKKMSEGQLCALSRWLTGDPQAFFGAELRDGIAGEMQRVYDAAMEAQGQVEMMPEVCEACRDFEEMLSRLPLYGAAPILDSALAHRARCRIWLADNPQRKTEAERLKELGY